jgi:hypothetical protein
MKIIYFVEGFKDELFLQNIIPKITGNSEFKIFKYSQQPKCKTNNYIKSITRTVQLDYILLSDADSQSIDDKKRSLAIKFSQLNSSNIIIVKTEIESWYIAGMQQKTLNKLKNRNWTKNPESITKEEFNKIINSGRGSIEYMTRILQDYLIDQAIKRAPTFSDFVKKIKSLNEY